MPSFAHSKLGFFPRHFRISPPCFFSDIFFSQWSEPENWLCCSVGDSSTWVTIARDSESEYPFYFVGQFCRIWAGHLFSPFLKVGRLCGNCFLNHSTLIPIGCDWANVGHPACLLKKILIDSNLPVTCWHPWSFKVVLTAPKTSNFDLIWFERTYQPITARAKLSLTKMLYSFFSFCEKPEQISIVLSPSVPVYKKDSYPRSVGNLSLRYPPEVRV